MAFSAGPPPLYIDVHEGPLGAQELIDVIWTKLQELEDEQYVENFENMTYTYNGDGTIATIIQPSKTLTFTYNPDTSIATMSGTGFTKTFSYNGDGSLASIVES